MAEIDLHRGDLELDLVAVGADLVDHLFRRPHPGRARFHLSLERFLEQRLVHLVVARIVLARRALDPGPGRIEYRLEVAVDRVARDLDRLAAVLVAEHVEGEHHLAVPRMAGRPPSLAIDPEKVDHRRGDQRDRHDVVAQLARLDEGRGSRRRRRPDRRARLLGRARQRSHVLEAVKAPLAGDVFLFEQEADLRRPLVEAGDAFIQADAELLELVRQEGARHAEIEPAAGDRVQHARLAGDLERVVEHRQHRAGDDARVLRPLAGGAQKHHRRRAVTAIVEKVVLDSAHMRVAVDVHQIAERQALRKILGAGLGVRADGRKELDAEFHSRSPR